MYDPITTALLAGITLLIVFGIAFCCLRHFGLAVILVILSPWLPSIFSPNAAQVLGEKATNIGSYLRISLLFLMGGVGFIKFWMLRSYQREIFPSHFVLLGFFILLGMISVSYSIDQQITLIRSASFMALFWFLLGLNSWLITKNRVNRIFHMILIAISLCLIANLLSVAILPGKVWAWNMPNRLQGLASHPNTLGAFCMISYPILLWKHSHSQHSRKWLVTGAIAVLVVLHLLSGSRTSIFAAVFGISLWFFVLKKRANLMLLIGGGIVAVLFLFAIKPDLASFVRTEHGDASLTDLTGRTDFWRAGYILAMEKPLLGYGYAVGGKVFADPRFYEPELFLWSASSGASLHNGYLTIAVGTGLTGLLLFGLLLYKPLILSINAYTDEYKAFVLTIMSMCLLVNFFETSIVEGSTVSSILFWVAWVLGGRIFNLESHISEENDIRLGSELHLEMKSP